MTPMVSTKGVCQVLLYFMHASQISMSTWKKRTAYDVIGENSPHCIDDLFAETAEELQTLITTVFYVLHQITAYFNGIKSKVMIFLNYNTLLEQLGLTYLTLMAQH